MFFSSGLEVMTKRGISFVAGFTRKLEQISKPAASASNTSKITQVATYRILRTISVSVQLGQVKIN